MIHFDHEFLVEVSYDIYSSSKFDLDDQEKYDAIEELIDHETQSVLNRFNLEGITKDQYRYIKETLRGRISQFLITGFHMTKSNLEENRSTKVPRNINLYCHSDCFNEYFPKFKRSNFETLGVLCENIQDYKNLVQFHNSDEKTFLGKKDYSLYPLNRNLYEVNLNKKTLIEIQESFKEMKDKIERYKRRVRYFEKIITWDSSDLGTHETKHSLRDRLSESAGTDIEARFIRDTLIHEMEQEWDNIKSMLKSLVDRNKSRIEKTFTEMKIQEKRFKEIQHKIIELIETSTLKLSYYEQYKNQLKEVLNKEAAAV